VLTERTTNTTPAIHYHPSRRHQGLSLVIASFGNRLSPAQPLPCGQLSSRPKKLRHSQSNASAFLLSHNLLFRGTYPTNGSGPEHRVTTPQLPRYSVLEVPHKQPDWRAVRVRDFCGTVRISFWIHCAASWAVQTGIFRFARNGRNGL
jgi:hypothetical protein